MALVGRLELPVAAQAEDGFGGGATKGCGFFSDMRGIVVGLRLGVLERSGIADGAFLQSVCLTGNWNFYA